MPDAKKHLQKIIRENGADRVRAVLALARLEAETGEFVPPVSDTHTLMLESLVRIHRSAGRALVQRAMALAFPVTLKDGGSNGADLAGPAASGDSLD